MEDEVLSTELQSATSLEEVGRLPTSGPWLLEAGGPGAVTSRVIRLSDSVVIGNRAPAEWRIPDRTVSCCHVRLWATAEGLELEDLGSRNGTFVGGARVRRARLMAGASSFSLGSSTVSVSLWRPESAAKPLRPISGLLGNSEPMRRLVQTIRTVASLNAPVLLQGESGTGKDIVASAIHRLSERAGQYVALNAGALSDSLADSELFGHRRGAFTGAVQTHAGAFEQADKGTLFLDEVADLSPAIQVKLLRAVETGEVRQLGGVAPLRVRTRIVAATWAPLEQLVEQGRFRADLYHRISTFVIHIPPLRSRKSDLPVLARFFLNSQKEQLGIRHLSDSALARLSAHNFPGNVRELFAILYRAAVMSEGAEITPHHINSAIPTVSSSPGRSMAVDAHRLLEAHDGNVSAAARSVRVARSTFRSWLKRSPSTEINH